MPSTIRQYSGPTDLQAMIELLVAVRQPERVSDWPGVVELHELMARPAVTVNTRLWWHADRDSARLSAWAFVDEFDNLHFELRPGELSESELQGLFDWAGSVVAGRSSDREPALDASAHEADGDRIVLLLRHGFAEAPHRTLSYVRPLDDEIPAPALPPGFAIRPLRSGEVEAVASLHRAAFGTEYMTVENRCTMMSGAEYDPTGDLVAVAPDGRLVAYTIASISDTENATSGAADGFTDPVATHPEFQRRGLARAVLLAGCLRLRARGATRARLGTSSENLAMQRAAESAGFRLDHVTRRYSRAMWEDS